jgi:hypothetical protein
MDSPRACDSFIAAQRSRFFAVSNKEIAPLLKPDQHFADV